MVEITVLEIIRKALSKDMSLQHITTEDVLANNLSDGDRERIIDELVSILCTDGLNLADEPNDIGLKVEDIIDALVRATR